MDTRKTLKIAVQELSGYPPWRPIHLRLLLSEPGMDLWPTSFQKEDEGEEALVRWLARGEKEARTAESEPPTWPPRGPAEPVDASPWTEPPSEEQLRERYGTRLSKLQNRLEEQGIAPLPDDISRQALNTHLGNLVEDGVLERLDNLSVRPSGWYRYNRLHGELSSLRAGLVDPDAAYIGNRGDLGLPWNHIAGNQYLRRQFERSGVDPHPPFLLNGRKELDEKEREALTVIGDLLTLLGDALRVLEVGASTRYEQEADHPSVSEVQEMAQKIEREIATPRFLCINVTPGPGVWTEAHGSYERFLDCTIEEVREARNQLTGEDGWLWGRFDPQPD